jgi:hypothetical protein
MNATLLRMLLPIFLGMYWLTLLKLNLSNFFC